MLPWDADRLEEKAKDTREDEGEESASNIKLWEYFEQVSLGEKEEPCVIVDCHGRILLWYLPGILKHRVVSATDLYILHH